MAPEIAIKAASSVPIGSVVLDTMCGSGTVLRESVKQGHRAIGFDVDPLAVLMSKVATTSLDVDLLIKKADNIANHAMLLNSDDVYLPWIDNDYETQKFIEFWFDHEQRNTLRALCWLILRVHGPIGDALRLAISKIIITKEPRASLARDTSHSRPHRVICTNSYDVIQGFTKAIIDITKNLNEKELTGTAEIKRADARHLPSWLTEKVHLVVTSPPYGNAIDYLRGHRLALVWLGYTIPKIRAIRDNNIGRQSGSLDRNGCSCVSKLMKQLGCVEKLEPSTQRRLSIFVKDMYLVLHEINRSLMVRGHAILVVGNSFIDGQFLDNARMISAAGRAIGFKEIACYSRDIPNDHRYLPPPTIGGNSALDNRMRQEVVLTFEKK
ncbi:MAG: hypothetical protein WC359_10695 [Dehalococcoidia bacterium]|jgi:hypothetical protein